jgi:hypothetical protein
VRRLLFRGFLGLLTTVAVAAPARAIAAGPADVAAADALFREARGAARRGDYATACPKFRESYRLDPTVGTLLNTADCEEHDGRLVDALLRFEEALGRLAPSDDRLTYVRSRIHALEERVPRIVGTLPSGAALRVLVDGTDVTSERRPLVIRVEPGAHELRVVGPGRDERVTLVLKDGEGKEIDLSRSIARPPPAAPPPASPEPPPARRSSTRHDGLDGVTIALGGVGVAALAASGVAVALMFHEKKTADAHCVGSECDQTGIDATAAGKRYGTLGGAAFGVSAVALGIGTFLFFRGREPSKERVSVGPSVGPGAGGVVVGGVL